MVFFLGASPITFSAKKQAIVAHSSTEAKYRALTTIVAKLCWIKMVLKDLVVYLATPPMMWCDNIYTLALASYPVFHARTKHIEVDYPYIREKVFSKELRVNFIKSELHLYS